MTTPKTDNLMSDLQTIEDHIIYLQHENARLHNIINAGIKEHCGYFCALPVCAKGLCEQQESIPF